MLLSAYVTNVRDVINDPNIAYYPAASLQRWINRARTKTAKDSECIRLLTPYTASVTGFVQGATGSGYVAPTVTLTGPDAIAGPNYVTATATATLTGDQVTAVNVANPGSGYQLPPTVTISDAAGAGAAYTATLGPHWTTAAGVELYQFTAATTSLNNAGVKAVIDILGISVAYAGTKPTLMQTDFATLQAMARSFGMGQMYPGVWAKYGQGEAGSFYLYPTPSSVYGMEADCVCTPADLTSDSSPDLIPDAWNEPVFYYAAYLAYQFAHRMDDSKAMLGEYQRLLASARANTGAVIIPSLY